MHRVHSGTAVLVVRGSLPYTAQRRVSTLAQSKQGMKFDYGLTLFACVGEAQRLALISAPQVNGVCSFRFSQADDAKQCPSNVCEDPKASMVHSSVSNPLVAVEGRAPHRADTFSRASAAVDQRGML